MSAIKKTIKMNAASLVRDELFSTDIEKLLDSNKP